MSCLRSSPIERLLYTLLLYPTLDHEFSPPWSYFSAQTCHTPVLQEVFLTPHHLAIAMEYAPGGDLSLLVDQCRARGVRLACLPRCD